VVNSRPNMGRTQWGTGTGEGEGDDAKTPPPVVPVPAPDSGAVPTVEATSDRAGISTGVVSPTGPRPARLTPGSSGLVTLLAQNRPKTGKTATTPGSGDDRGASDARTPSGAFESGAFELLDITAVGGAVGTGAATIDPAVGTGRVRLPRLTPGEGLPALLARTRSAGASTMLGVGDAASVNAPGAGSRDAQEIAAVGEGASKTASKTENRSGTPTDEEPAASDQAGGDSAAVAESSGADTGVDDFSVANTAVDPGKVVAQNIAADAATLAPIEGAVIAAPVSPSTEITTAAVVLEPYTGDTSDVAYTNRVVPAHVGVAASDVAGAAVSARDPNAPRPKRLTPGSGGLAALLAQTRRRTGRQDILEKKTARASLDDAVPTITPPPVQPIERTGSGAVGMPSVAQEKSGAFASTLMGLPAPDLSDSRPMRVVVQPAPSGAVGASTAFGRDRHLPRDFGTAAAIVSRPVYEGDATEKSLSITGDVAAEMTSGRSIVPSDPVRVTEVIPVVRPNRTPRIMAGVVVAVVVAVVGVALMQGKHRGVVDADTARPGRSATAVAAPENLSPVAPATETPPVPAAVTPAVAAEPQSPGEKAAAVPEKIEKNEAESGTRRAAAVPTQEPKDEPKDEPKRKVSARVESTHAEPKKTPTKSRRRGGESHAGLSDFSAGVATPSSAEPQKTKAAATARPLENDPDATLPLTTR
jgi:hypothetical protein